MKTIFFTLGLVLIAASFAAADVTKGTYLGTSKTTVKYLDPNTLQPVATEVFTRNETVIVGAAKSAGGVTEGNPFSLNVVPTTRATPPADGEVTAASARIFPTGAGVLVQYWLLQNTVTGFTGQLASNHLAQGLAKDRVIANLGGPGGSATAFKMHDGQFGVALPCTLNATGTGRQMTLKITGYALVLGQAIVQFTTKITAQR